MPLTRAPIAPRAHGGNHSGDAVRRRLCQALTWTLKAKRTFAYTGLPHMKIRFADDRPEGDFALVLPIAGNDRSSLRALGSSQQAVATALDRQRFEGEASSVSEQFIDDKGATRRLLLVGTGAGPIAGEAAEKLGGTAAARLQTSGEKTAVIDLGGLGYDADAAARVGL